MRIVREVGVHLDQQLGPSSECVCESRAIRMAQTLLGGAVKHLYGRQLGRHGIGDRARTVR